LNRPASKPGAEETPQAAEYLSWFPRFYREMTGALGWSHLPREELEGRIARVRKAMGQKEMEALLVLQKMDRYYLSGSTQDGLLYLPLEGEPLFLVRRELARARLESPLGKIRPLGSARRLPAILREEGLPMPKTLGLEWDVLPVRESRFYESLFPKTRFMDGSEAIRGARSVKSPWEIGWIRKAGLVGKAVYEAGAKILKQGMTEITFGGLLEAEAKRLGHEGLLRVRSLNYEAYTWHVLSGECGAVVSQSDSPMGGLGLSPAFPVGASLRVIQAGEPVLVDFGTCINGYQADETRVFSLGRMPPFWTRAYAACREIHDAVLERVRPGVLCDELFRFSVGVAERLGFGENYLGPRGLQTRFVGHGIGLELNEPPFIALGHTEPLEEGMTFALEPKMVFPGEGSVGIENTVVVRAQGFEILTPASQEIYEVPWGP